MSLHDLLEDMVAAEVDRAVAVFTTAARSAVMQSLIADAEEDGQHIDPYAILGQQHVWDQETEQTITPAVLAALIAAAAWELDRAGYPTPPPNSTTPPPGRAAAAMDVLTRSMNTTHPNVVSVGEWLVHQPNWQDYIEEYAHTVSNRVVGMPEAIYRELSDDLAKATRDGATPTERAKVVEGSLDLDTEGGFDKMQHRSRRIARTETNTSVNAGTLEAAKAEASLWDEELQKAWIATTDPRTRDSHFRADGQRRALGEKFQIGEHEADFPGDPSLPAGECINCRCSLLILGKDDPLPNEADRQTERERSDGTTRNPQAEVDRRADRGVTRDRDDQATITAAAEETPMRQTWSGILAPVGTPTGDGRIIDADAAVEFREFPQPLMYQRATSGGHDSAVVVGKITTASAGPDGITAEGEFFDSIDAAEAAEMVTEGVIRPSVDMCDMVTEWELLDKDGQPVDMDDPDAVWEDGVAEVMHVRSCTIMAATLVAKPAFAEAKITVTGNTEAAPEVSEEEAALVASAAAVVEQRVDSEAFMDPGLSGPTALTVTEDGRVFGHLALWGTEHVGVPGRVTPPKSPSDYAFFHVSTVDTTTGPVACGRLTVGCGHADGKAGHAPTVEHYDTAGTCWALVRAGEDAHGIYVSGIVNPDASEEQVRAGASAPLSGDWRSIGGHLELVAALSVNTPGFPVPRSYAARQDRTLSLVAAGAIPHVPMADRQQVDIARAVADGLRLRDEEVAAQQQAQARVDLAEEYAARVRALHAQGMARQIGAL